MEGELESSKSLVSTDGAQSSLRLRRTANYKPSLWDDKYVQSLPDGCLDAGQVNLWEKLKEEVRHLITYDKQFDIAEQLEIIDVLCQLGISYHFKSEIKNVLSFIASSLDNLNNISENNLHDSALLFRLLREFGIKALRDDFFVESLKNENGSFEVNLMNGLKGMLSLYEASYLAIEDDVELDKAMEFTTKHLSNVLKKPLNINHALVEQISNALELPLHLKMSRVHTRWFIDAYEKQEKMNPTLLEFSKLDFNMLQSVYKKELKEIYKWWRNLGITGDEFNFTRNRTMEIYFLSVGASFEPQFWRCRIWNAKLVCLLTTIDDIYDLYGYIEELELFTNVVAEWDITKIQLLPNYMKKTFTALINTVNDMAHDISKEKGLNILPHLKQAWINQCKSYIMEARWYNTLYIPTLNEYLENAWLSIGAPVTFIFAYCSSEDLTKEALNSLQFYSDATRYSSILLRLYNDLATSKDEMERGDVPKSIQCHMNEANVSESIAREHIKALIKRYWKLLNGEYISYFNMEESFKQCIINFPRAVQFIYQNGDGYGNPEHETKDAIISLLIKPIP